MALKLIRARATRAATFYGLVSGLNPTFDSLGPWQGKNRAQIQPPAGDWLIEVESSAPVVLYVGGAQAATSAEGTVRHRATLDGATPVFPETERGHDGVAVVVRLSELAPPPLRNCKVLALVGVVLSGFTQNGHQPRRGSIHPHRRFWMENTHRQESDMGNGWGILCNPRTGHLPHRGSIKCRPIQPLAVGKRGEYHSSNRGGVLRGQATVLPVQRDTEDHQTVAPVGGGRRGA